MSSWKTWAGLTLLVLLAVVMYPRAGGVRAEKGGESQGKTTLVLWTKPSVAEPMRTALEEFERENPEYTVQLGAATVRDANADPTRFLLGVAGGMPPDAIVFDRYAVVEWAARGAFADLTPYLKNDEGRADGVHRENYFAPLWEEGHYKGGQYAIPNGVDTRAMFLSDDLLTRAGFVNADGTVRAPKTWEEICRKKFHGTGSVTADGVVRLGKAGTLPGVGEFPVSGGEAKAGDVVTLRSGKELFRARIKDVDAEGTIRIDFSRELAAGVTSVPEALVGAKDLEVKVFDGESYAVAMTRYDDQGNIDVLGFSPLSGNSWLYLYGWQNGASFVSEDGEKIHLGASSSDTAIQQTSARSAAVERGGAQEDGGIGEAGAVD